MGKPANTLCAHPFTALLPKPEFHAMWPVVACDQYTSEPEYWASVEKMVGYAPSALHLMLPELYLEAPDVKARIEAIHQCMRRYLDEGVFEQQREGYVLVRRTVDGKTRRGLMMALDLEQYDFSAGSQSLIRATEGTIVSRIPPRMRIRDGAALEMPHILVLIDDARHTVIEPLFETKLPKLYDIELMKNGGRVEGFFLSPQNAQAALQALEALERNAQSAGGMLFAVGDGNHSLATAKTHWEQCKAELSEEAKLTHPARYALVEVENVHDDGIVFEPIHRVIFGVETMACLTWLCSYMRAHNAGATNYMFQERETMLQSLNAQPDGVQAIPYVIEDACGFLRVEGPAQQLHTSTLQAALDAYLLENPVVLDYVHGDDVVTRLGQAPGNIGFILPGMPKEALFPAVIKDGSLPRKMFSMGQANEKRFYLECRRIVS